MKILKLMRSNPKVIHPDSTIAEAAQLMRRIDAGVLPVVEDNVVIGMVTDRDITIRATSNGKDPNVATVREVMTPEVICCYDDEKVQTAGKTMLERGIGRLPVLNRSNLSLAGIVSLADIISKSGGKQLIERGRSSVLAKSKYSIPALLAIGALGLYARSCANKAAAKVA